jgi:Zn-dependent protease with chaperone function
MEGFSLRAAFRSGNRAPGQLTGTGTAVPTVAIQGVTFQLANQRPNAERHRRRVSAALFVVMAGWSGILAAYGQPILGPIAAVVWLELAVASYRIAGVTGSVTEDQVLALRIAPLLTDMCARLGCALPWVSVRDDNLRVAGIRLLRKQPVLILSRSLAIRLSDAELRGIMAHEVAHLASGDLESARRRGLWASVLALGVALSLVVFGADFYGLIAPPVWGALWVVLSLVFTTALAPLNRPRETRADAVAAAICADSSVVASALPRAVALTKECHQAVYGRAPLRWLLLPVSWRLPSHPTIEQRTARLGSMPTLPVIADLLGPRAAPAPPSALSRAGERVAMVGGAGLFAATLLPWMITTDTSLTYLTYSYPGTYSTGKFATMCGLMIALVGVGIARSALARTDRIVLASFMLGLSIAAALVLIVKVNEIGTWYQSLGGYETAAPASGIYIAAACIGAAIIGSLMAVAGAFGRTEHKRQPAHESAAETTPM